MTWYPQALTPLQADVYELACQLAKTKIAPLVASMESGSSESLQALQKAWDALRETGLLSLAFDEEQNDSLSYLLVLVALAQVSPSFAVAVSVHTSVGSLPLRLGGSEALKNTWLPQIASGQAITAFGLTEPNAGSDTSGIQTVAIPTLEGYCLNGSKLFISNAQMASVFLITAKVNGQSTAFLIHRDMPGFRVIKGEGKLGLCGGDWGELVFDQCMVPLENRLGQEGEGRKLFLKSLELGRLGISAIGVGLMQACLQLSATYAKQRQQFGQSIASFQAIQFKLADMAMHCTAGFELLRTSSQLKDQALPFGPLASAAKLYTSEHAWQCAQEAVQIFGGYGYTKEFPIERFWRDARSLTIIEGTSEIQRLIISRDVLKDVLKDA